VAYAVSLALFDLCPDEENVYLTVEIALTSATGQAAIWDVSLWDVGVWGPDQTWEDVSEWVMGLSFGRKFSSDLKSWQTAQFTLTLTNMDGRFSPDNLTGPYAAGGITGIRPGCAFRATMTYAGIVYPIFRGYVTSWADELSGHYGEREGGAVTIVQGTDEWGRIARPSGSAVAPVGAGESFGSRINRLLIAAGFSGTTDLDTGITTMQATDLSDAPVNEIGVTASSEGGAVWPEADGTMVARDRYSLIEDIRSITVQETFGDATTETPWADVKVTPVDDSGIVNTARYTRTGGTEQVAFDPISRELYGICDDKSSNTSNLMNETDAQVLALAQWIVLVNKEPEAKVEQLTIRPLCDLPVYAPKVLGLMIRDLIRVICRPPSATSHLMDRSCFISGINFTIERGDWVAVFDTSSATAYRVYADSRWDTGLWGYGEGDPNAARWFV
jgi:hypothetical protein